jgi:putative endonuclease
MLTHTSDSQVFYLYILRSDKTSRHCVGSTGDLADRLRRHNSGYSKSTKHGVPGVLVHAESFQTKSEAVLRELQIKSWKSSGMIAKLVARKHSD